MLLKLKSFNKYLLVIGSFILVSFSLYYLYEMLSGKEELNFVYISLCILISSFFTISTIYSATQKISLFEDLIIKKTIISTITKSFYDINRIYFIQNGLLLRFKDCKIDLPSSFQNQKEAIVFILDKLKDRKEVKVVRPQYLKNWLGEEGAKEFMEGRSQ